MSAVSVFFTAYSARRGEQRVEAVAVVVEGEGSTASLRFVVVDERGRASIAAADEVDLYGVLEESYAAGAVDQVGDQPPTADA